MNRNALNASEPSERTELFMFQRNLEEEWEENPMQLLAKLDEELRTKPTRDLLFVLMELCYLEGQQHAIKSPEAAKLYLSCAVYRAFIREFTVSPETPISVQKPQ